MSNSSVFKSRLKVLKISSADLQLYDCHVVITACCVLYVASMDTESLTGPEAVTKATDSIFKLDPAPKTTVVHFKVSSQGITLTDLRHRSFCLSPLFYFFLFLAPKVAYPTPEG